MVWFIKFMSLAISDGMYSFKIITTCVISKNLNDLMLAPVQVPLSIICIGFPNCLLFIVFFFGKFQFSYHLRGLLFFIYEQYIRVISVCVRASIRCTYCATEEIAFSCCSHTYLQRGSIYNGVDVKTLLYCTISSLVLFTGQSIYTCIRR